MTAFSLQQHDCPHPTQPSRPRPRFPTLHFLSVSVSLRQLMWPCGRKKPNKRRVQLLSFLAYALYIHRLQTVGEWGHLIVASTFLPLVISPGPRKVVAPSTREGISRAHLIYFYFLLLAHHVMQNIVLSVLCVGNNGMHICCSVRYMFGGATCLFHITNTYFICVCIYIYTFVWFCAFHVRLAFFY